MAQALSAAMSLDLEYDESGEEPPATPAATLVIFRRDAAGGAPQILMVERSASMKFAGGAAVFPGGRVDDADRELAQALGAADEEAVHELAARIAAVRETLEETGLVVGIRQRPSLDEARRAREILLAEGTLAPTLAAMGWELDLDALVPFARWRPKHRHMRIFDTRFYLADLGTGAVDLLVDETENTRLFWTGAAEALEHADAGRISVIFPTRRNLERLAQFGSFDEAVAHVEVYPSRMITPFLTEEDGQKWLRIPHDAGYPVTGEVLESAARG
ncbi:MAG: NUDIX domain-containing protein [Pseudomonadota bacterium]|nr:NUDIX domain-containing protein [Pseudomonadota bacterium]